MSILDADDEDGVFGVGISELERRSSLERIRADGVAVEIELTEDTAFSRYVRLCRKEAIAAMNRMAVDVDPNDASSVLECQQIIKAYLHVRSFALGAIEKSIDADQRIQEDASGYLND